ncbi:hypothetical protein [Runella sp. SP2]|uniref:hypothetical protein n=1 Tax=Runella sp. SP2 TaxID=2268026 RepID=UPI0013DDFB60|nr:hypothetical protein [Runella sp. SP2]
MTAALIISGIVLLWYVARESRENKPNWARAFNVALFWPLSLVFKVSASKSEKQQGVDR